MVYSSHSYFCSNFLLIVSFILFSETGCEARPAHQEEGQAGAHRCGGGLPHGPTMGAGEDGEGPKGSKQQFS